VVKGSVSFVKGLGKEEKIWDREEGVSVKLRNILSESFGYLAPHRGWG